MTDRELMRQAVVALDLAMLHGEYPQDAGIFREISNAANALSARLAQPESGLELNKVLIGAIWDSSEIVASPQREWQGLTDEEYEAMAEQYVTNCYFDTLEYAKAIEAKLKEKNT
jgi:hypothetical protein